MRMTGASHHFLRCIMKRKISFRKLIGVTSKVSRDAWGVERVWQRE
jgi:hypothetical protein